MGCAKSYQLLKSGTAAELDRHAREACRDEAESAADSVASLLGRLQPLLGTWQEFKSYSELKATLDLE